MLTFISTSPGVVGKREIGRALGVKGKDKIVLKAILKSLENKGALGRKGKRITSTALLPPVAVLEIAGIDRDGYAYAVPVEWNVEHGPHPHILLRNDSAIQAPGIGDRVLARIETLPERDDYRYRARVMKPLSREALRIVGIYRQGRIIPTGRKDKHDYIVLRGDEAGAQDGELVAAEVTRSAARGLPQARIRKRLGDSQDPRNTSLIAIHAHGIPDHLPETVLREAESLKPFAREKREDLRHIPLVTIDPIDARDHDDAVWATADDNPENPGGHKVIVAIADVAVYVRPGTALDREARRRGNSVYFPDRVVPMLPERISNNLCSLVELEDRPALACHMVFDAHGRKRSHRFTRAIMRSHAKLAYEDAQAAIDGAGREKAKAMLTGTLRPLWAAFATLSRARNKRCPLELDLPERRVVLNSQGRVERVVLPQRLDAHRLIEEFMIQANVAAAEELIKRRTPALFRVHDHPSQEKLRALSDFLRTVGIPFSLGQVIRSKHFNQILASAKGTAHERLIHEVVLRSQAQAQYCKDNGGHFGLSLTSYTHFTSPIRRYSDLIVHRALITALKLGSDGLTANDIDQLDATADLVNIAERRAMIAERETIDRLVASHLSGQMGATFPARITGVVSAGLFVSLENTGADGFVPASALGRGHFVFDEPRHALVEQSSGETFQLGDSVEVRLTEVTPIKGGMKFDMVSEGKMGFRPARFGRKQKPDMKRRR